MKILRKTGRVILSFILLSIFAPFSANAALFDVPLPTNAFISLNGLDWAWGSNCANTSPTGCDTLSFAFQASQGWRIAEASDMPLAPTALDFLFPGGNVPFNGADPVTGAVFNGLNAAYTNAQSAGACASAYFTLGDGQLACNWLNGGGQNTNTDGWFNQNGETRDFADVLFVRRPSEIPVPAAVWLFGTALIGFVGIARKRKIG